MDTGTNPPSNLSPRNKIWDKKEGRLICITDTQDFEKYIEKMDCLKELFLIEDKKCKQMILKKKVPNLKKLVLYSNALTKIPKLSKCTFLEVLNLSDNNITSTVGLEQLEFLKDLNLGKNLISSIDCELEKNGQLEILNLSANPITSFQNIIKVLQVKSLQKMYLADPLYGECPIVNELSHYRLQIIHYMPFLKELDSFEIELNDKKLVQNFINNYILQYESQYEKFKSNIKYEEEINLVKCFLEKREMFAKLHKLYLKQVFSNKKPILESRFTVLRHGITNFKSQFIDTWLDYKERNLLRETYLVLEKESLNTFKIEPVINPDSQKTIANTLRDSCSCRQNKNKCLIKDITINNVKFLNYQNIENYKYKNEMNFKGSKFYLMKSPYKITNLREWRNFILNDSSLFENRKIIATDCLISCDSEYLSNVKHNYMKPPIKETRVVMLVEIETEEEIKSEHKKLDHHGDGDNCLCKELFLSSAGCSFYAVEFQYELNDKYELIRDITTLRKDLEQPIEPIKPIAFPFSDINQNLTSIYLRSCNIQNVGNEAEVFVNVLTLDVSCNELTTLNPLLTVFPNLKQLIISHNSLSELKPIRPSPFIEYLDISWNDVDKFLESSKSLSISMKNLRELKIEYNPIKDIIDEYQQAYFAKGLFFHMENFNGINMKILNTDDVYIKDDVTEREKNIILKELMNERILTTWGLVHRIENYNCAQHIIKFRKTCDEIKGVCIKPSQPVVNVNVDILGLKWMSVRYNYLSKLKFESKLTNLNELYLSHNQIKCIDFDFNLMPNLKRLDLSYNFIENIAPMRNANLQQLTYLNLSGNYIEQLNYLVNLHSIEQLYVSWNRITQDLNNLRRIKNLEKLRSVDITGNPLNKIPNMKFFISDNFPLIQYINGEEIMFENEKLNVEFKSSTLNTSSLMKMFNRGELTNLTQLTLTDHKLKEIELSKIVVPNLVSLNLERNEIECLNHLSDFPNLRTLRLSHNKMKGLNKNDCSGENKSIFHSLETLYLDNNNIEQMETFTLNQYHNLKYLFLHSNKISDLKGLEDNKKLRVLVLDKNEISLIPTMFFAKYKFLNHLYLESNKLQDLKFTRNIVSPLVKLFLAYNKIKDFQTLDHLKFLKQLKEVTLLGNNVSWKANYYTKVISILEHVQYIDGHNIQDQNTD